MGTPTFRNPRLAGVKGYPYKVGDGKKLGPEQDAIRAIQMLMLGINYSVPGSVNFGSDPSKPISFTGVFDKKMEEMVKKFQLDTGLIASGVADESFLRKLDDLTTPTPMDFYIPIGTSASGTVPFEMLHKKETIEYDNTPEGWEEWVSHVDSLLPTTSSFATLRTDLLAHLRNLDILFDNRLYEIERALTNAYIIWAESVKFPGGVRPHVAQHSVPDPEFEIAGGTFAILLYAGAIVVLEDGYTYQNVATGPVSGVKCTPLATAATKPKRPGFFKRLFGKKKAKA